MSNCTIVNLDEKRHEPATDQRKWECIERCGSKGEARDPHIAAIDSAAHHWAVHGSVTA